VKALIRIYDKKKNLVSFQYANENLEGEILVPNATLWWPYLMHPDPGYLYNLEVHLITQDQSEGDVYRMKVGIRTLKWNQKQFLINDKPVYFRGFGRHEDSDVFYLEFLTP
jgi:beta-glucuronidase